jgi:hypothetical protein
MSSTSKANKNKQPKKVIREPAAGREDDRDIDNVVTSRFFRGGIIEFRITTPDLVPIWRMNHTMVAVAGLGPLKFNQLFYRRAFLLPAVLIGGLGKGYAINSIRPGPILDSVNVRR